MDKYIRTMDNLGRIVIPKLIRESLYNENDCKCYMRDFEISICDGCIILKRIENDE